MSEEGSEPDIKPRRMNVADVPQADTGRTQSGYPSDQSFPGRGATSSNNCAN
jgi:hypothetical protein